MAKGTAHAQHRKTAAFSLWASGGVPEWANECVHPGIYFHPHPACCCYACVICCAAGCTFSTLRSSFSAVTEMTLLLAAPVKQ